MRVRVSLAAPSPLALRHLADAQRALVGEGLRSKQRRRARETGRNGLPSQ